MTFEYESSQAIRNLDATSPFAQAVDTLVASVQWTLTVALWLLAALGPPMLVALLAFLVWRRIGPWLRRNRAPAPD